ncbi:MAG TPA: HNH endonuclease, partial [Kofleriaceae bacterium]|nr:HNH endonuclease [Kofleriaceae bacterium]
MEATWAVEEDAGGEGGAAKEQSDRDEDTCGASYREIDRQLRRLAKRRAALDSEEARWLREADAQQIWKKLGFSTALEYLEDVFGYAPRTALERLRVAKELGRLKELDASLADGELTYGAARELSRVMTPATERAWLARARGKNLRDIEELVAGHAKGDDPDDPKDESQQPRVVSFRVTPAIEALLRQTRADLSDECGHHVEDDELFEILCRRARDGGERQDGAPPPAYQISIRRCDECGRASQLAAGQWTPISPAACARAECDAIEIGDEADLCRRASRTITKKTRDHVWLRDAWRCRVPGCRAKRHCELHHIVPWAQGGTHDPENLIVLCSGHHMLLHDRLLTITGRAPDELTFTRDGKPLVDPRSADGKLLVDPRSADGKPLVDRRSAEEVAACEPIRRSARGAARAGADSSSPRDGRARTSYGDVVMRTEAKVALRQLGYKAAAAKEAVDRACAALEQPADVAAIVSKALQLDRATMQAGGNVSPEDNERLACKALVQS